MKVMLAMFVAAAMTFGVSSAFAGSSCSLGKKSASKECGSKASCEGKTNEECAAACAAKKADAKLCACGFEKGSDECTAACTKDETAS